MIDLCYRNPVDCAFGNRLAMLRISAFCSGVVKPNRVRTPKYAHLCTKPNRRFITMGASAPVHKSRITLLKTGVEPKSPTHVLYWMSTALRVRENPSLEHAAYLSNRHQVPLRVMHVLDSTAPDEEPLPERHALFQLQSVRDIAKSLADRRIPFTVHHAGDDLVSVLASLADGAAAIIADADYLRRGRAVRHALAKKISVPLYVVEANVVVPVETASEKAEYAARTIRPRITRPMKDYLIRTPTVELKHQPKKISEKDNVKEGDLPRVTVKTDKQIESVLKDWEGLDREATRVKRFEGGEEAAQKTLKEFLKSRLPRYENGRNEPSLQLQSDLSPYLRMGSISPIDVVLSVDNATNDGSKFSGSRDSFIEELVIRRELSVNACWFNDRYDEYQHVVPNFAQKTLEEHKNDKREYIYSYEEFEAAVTHDEFWNAAQLEMIVRGKMHGYMRMYWAKQIIGWTADPVDAMRIAQRLNNRWELDAVDPNSYVGVNWCFGLHDHGWTERPVWGKVRYMNENGLKRKFDMDAYLSMVQSLIDEDGLPEHIAKMRKGRKKDKQQTKIDDAPSSSKKKTKSSRKSSDSEGKTVTRSSKRSKRN